MADRQIAQNLVTRHGTVVRDTDQPLPELSSICLMDDHGQVHWFAELPQKDDSYLDEMTLLDADTLGLTSAFGWRCRIALKDGTMLSKEWMH